MNSVLTLEESKLLRQMYGLDGEETSLDDAAAEIGSSKDWARRAKAKALAKLRESHALDDFAEGVY
jgi:DNA-directed RNA polymerase sigma subunit (sigma70/sigma32)